MFKPSKSRDPRSPSRSQRDIDADYQASRYDAMRGYDQASPTDGSYNGNMPGSFDYSTDASQRTLYQGLKDSQPYAQPPLTPRHSGSGNDVPSRPVRLPPTPPTVSRPKSPVDLLSAGAPPIDFSYPISDTSVPSTERAGANATASSTTGPYSARYPTQTSSTSVPPVTVPQNSAPAPRTPAPTDVRATNSSDITEPVAPARRNKNEATAGVQDKSGPATPRARVLERSAETGNEGAEWEEILGQLSFHDDKENQFLDLVDDMHQHGLDRELSLPRLVVCGRQSSGKSSVLEAITRLPFPRGDIQCTTFVTEIRMIRDSKLTRTSVVVTIEPGEDRDGADRKALRAFKETCAPSGFVELFSKAANAMGIAKDSSGSVSAFSRDTLRVEIRGPHCQRISLIDIPGLISVNKGKADDIKLVESITDSYIKEERTIILAVVNAEGNVDGHTIFEKAKAVDPKGERTFVIITKPDLLEAGLGNEAEWFDLAQQNERAFRRFSKGCHVMVNRDGYATKDGTSSDDRDKHEEDFFKAEKWGPGSGKKEGKENRWHELYGTTHWGVKHLRPRLTQLLFRHTQTQIKSLRQDINKRIADYDTELARLNVGLLDKTALRKFLLSRCQKMSQITIDGVNGTNRDANFFGVDQFESANGPARYLRGRIREESAIFNNTLHSDGHRTEYVWGPDDETPDELPELDNFHTFLLKTVGTELPGNFDPQRTTPLFTYYSAPWHDLAHEYLNRAYQHSREFIRIVVHEGLQKELPDVAYKFSRDVLEGRLEKLKKKADEQLLAIEQDRKGNVITEDIRFLEKASGRFAIRQSRRLKRVASSDSFEGNKIEVVLPSDPASKRKEAAIGMIEEMLIYYKIARARYIDNIIIQVVERCLLSNLSELFEPGWLEEPELYQSVTHDPKTDDRRREKEGVDERRKNLKDCLVRLEMLDM